MPVRINAGRREIKKSDQSPEVARRPVTEMIFLRQQRTEQHAMPSPMPATCTSEKATLALKNCPPPPKSCFY